MKFIVLAEHGGQYYYDIDQAATMLGVSRRAIFDLLKRVNVEPSERRVVNQKSYYSEDVLGRIWALQRRYRPSEKWGAAGSVAKSPPEERGVENKLEEPSNNHFEPSGMIGGD